MLQSPNISFFFLACRLLAEVSCHYYELYLEDRYPIKLHRGSWEQFTQGFTLRKNKKSKENVWEEGRHSSQTLSIDSSLFDNAKELLSFSSLYMYNITYIHSFDGKYHFYWFLHSLEHMLLCDTIDRERPSCGKPTFQLLRDFWVGLNLRPWAYSVKQNRTI